MELVADVGLRFIHPLEVLRKLRAHAREVLLHLREYLLELALYEYLRHLHFRPLEERVEYLSAPLVLGATRLLFADAFAHLCLELLEVFERSHGARELVAQLRE